MKSDPFFAQIKVRLQSIISLGFDVVTDHRTFSDTLFTDKTLKENILSFVDLFSLFQELLKLDPAFNMICSNFALVLFSTK